MSDNQDVIVSNQSVLEKLASTFEEWKERNEVLRDLFVLTQTKSIWVGDQKKKINPFEALVYTMACKSLGLNPMLSHVIFLEDQVYITLQGHLQNAHNSGTLRGMKTELISEDKGSNNKNWLPTSKYGYRCTITKKVWENETAEFVAEWYAELDNIKNKYASNMFIQQMAEARAMRRCLARAFPVGMASIEDVEEEQIVQPAPQSDEITDITADIELATTTEELEVIKWKISEIKNNALLIKTYSKKRAELESKPTEPTE